MSDQPPLTPPTPTSNDEVPPGDFTPYAAPAYGQVAPDAPTLFGPPATGSAAGSPPVSPADATRPQPANPYAGNPYGANPYGAHPQGGAPGPGGQFPYQMAAQYGYNPVAPTHPMAVTSLVLGIIGIAGIVLTPVFLITFVSGLCSPFAIWLGAKARKEIRANPQAYGGEGMATGGFVTGIIGTVLAIIGLLLILAVVFFVAAALDSSW